MKKMTVVMLQSFPLYPIGVSMPQGLHGWSATNHIGVARQHVYGDYTHIYNHRKQSPSLRIGAALPTMDRYLLSVTTQLGKMNTGDSTPHHDYPQLEASSSSSKSVFVTDSASASFLKVETESELVFRSWSPPASKKTDSKSKL
ncbi:unnamed protein product [Cuscuta europaea]|uniref:Uncharacterized protein n=1 Tax=Cuscuta europaea TaxID=41803 RepID=A0A9P1EIT8_CUSEU|nr:unnamed protein product [Cuscuta europaea]